jgi:hypothetical protein
MDIHHDSTRCPGLSAAGHRHSLRPQFKAPPLYNAVGFARQVEDAYRALWMKACGGQASEGRASR